MVLSTGFRRRKKCDDPLWNHQRSGLMEGIKVGTRLRTELAREERETAPVYYQIGAVVESWKQNQVDNTTPMTYNND